MKIHTEYVQVIGDDSEGDAERYGAGEDTIDLADTYMGEDATIGEIFRACQREHGRCIGKVFVDRFLHSDPPKAIGWVFVKREKYEDVNEYFLHETWVTLIDKDETVRTVEYHEIGR